MIRIGWVGFHVEGLYAFENLLNKGITFQVFISLSDNAMSRRSAGTKKYKSICQKYNIPYYEVENINNDNVYELLKTFSLDLLVVIGWSQILSSRILHIAKLGTVGAHASLLPHNRGSAPINWAIIKGETLAGNTLMWLDEGVDTGKIIDQIPIPITKYDTCRSIYEEVAKTNYVLINRFLENVQTHIRDKFTNEEVLPRRRPADGLIEWSQSSNVIYDFIRALTKPYPGAFSFIEGKKWFIWECALVPLSEPMDQGLVIGPVVSPEECACGLLVACGKGAVIILEIESEDGELITGYDLAELNWKGKKWTNE